MRDHGTRTRYARGPDENDQPGPCRCDDCRRANREVSNRIYRLQAYGQWRPFVDAGPVRAHIEMLGRVGIKPKRVAELAGIAPQLVARIVNGVPSRNVAPSKRVRAATAEAILAVQASPGLLKDRARIDGTGTRRRLQALAALGWSQSRLADRLGMAKTNVGIAMHADGVRADTARKVRRLYDDLWNQLPPQATSRDRAAADQVRDRALAAGWLPPLAWDDDELDDPRSRPHYGRQRKSA